MLYGIKQFILVQRRWCMYRAVCSMSCRDWAPCVALHSHMTAKSDGHHRVRFQASAVVGGTRSRAESRGALLRRRSLPWRAAIIPVVPPPTPLRRSRAPCRRPACPGRPGDAQGALPPPELLLIDATNVAYMARGTRCERPSRLSPQQGASTAGPNHL